MRRQMDHRQDPIFFSSFYSLFFFFFFLFLSDLLTAGREDRPAHRRFSQSDQKTRLLSCSCFSVFY